MRSYIYILVYIVLFLKAFGYPGSLIKEGVTIKANKSTKHPKLSEPTTTEPKPSKWEYPWEQMAPTFRVTTLTEKPTTTPSEEKRRERRLQMRRQSAHDCNVKEHIRIEDEYGCEMCTCIYKKSLMLCSPFKCNGPEGERTLAGLPENLYNDYVLNVPTHFSEYKCEPGDIIVKSAACECECITQDILSCPAYCNMGKPLQG